MTFNFLMTCAGGELAPQMIKLLKSSTRHDIRVIAVDSNEDAIGRLFSDEFQTVPRGSSPDYVEAMAEVVAKWNVDLVLPASDEEAVALAANREAIEVNGCQLACASSKTLKIVSNKVACYEHLNALGMPTPEWRQTLTLEAVKSAAEEILSERDDVVIKPSNQRGGRGVVVVSRSLSGITSIDGGRELHMDPASFFGDFVDTYANFLPAIVMERLVDPVFDIDMLAWRGKPIRTVARKRIDSAAPNAGHTFVDNPALLELGRELIEKLDLSWLYDCDVMLDQNGQPQILEVNPRPSGSVATSIVAGIPLLDDIVSLAKSEPIEDIPLPIGRIVLPWKSLIVAN